MPFTLTTRPTVKAPAKKDRPLEQVPASIRDRVRGMRERESSVEARMARLEPGDPEHRRLELLVANARKVRRKLERG